MSNIQSANGTQPAPHAQHHQFEQSEGEERRRRRRQCKKCPSKAHYAAKEKENELEEVSKPFGQKKPINRIGHAKGKHGGLYRWHIY